MGLWRGVGEPRAPIEPKPIWMGFGLVGPEFLNARRIHTRILSRGSPILRMRTNLSNFYKIQNNFFKIYTVFDTDSKKCF